MKKYFCIGLALFACLVCQNCILSENAYYHEKDMVDLPAVEGEWKAVENKRDSNQHQILIIKEKLGKYTIIDKEIDKATKRTKSDTSKSVTLFKVGEDYYFDNFKPISNDSLKPVHFLEEIKIKNDKMDMFILSSKEMQKLIQKDKVPLKYLKKEDGTIIFTSPTTDLQNFLLLNKKNKNIFEKVGSVVKIK